MLFRSGLYISKQIVTSLNGKISINSEYRNGAEFLISIPNAKKAIKEKDQKISHLTSRQINILMIDDDPFNRFAFSALCKQIGVNIKCVATVSEFNKENEIYDLYILDLNLNDELNGIELANNLKSKGNDRPKILLTADASVHERVKGSAITDTIIKPVTSEELIGIIQRNIIS